MLGIVESDQVIVESTCEEAFRGAVIYENNIRFSSIHSISHRLGFDALIIFSLTAVSVLVTAKSAIVCVKLIAHVIKFAKIR